ncbi:MAG TPA: hypothetical protein VH722_03865 [Alphaproteobacteria bacterium]|jgi:hypothetical protein|nr:hypothetical protein [Alphaproteobacteria bacterium]
MMKYILTGAMALGLAAGVAHAQDDSVSRERTVVTQPDGDRTVNTQTTVNRDGPYGDHTVTKDTVRRSDGVGDSSTTSRTTRTNDTPYGDTSSTTVQRTTTDH